MVSRPFNNVAKSLSAPIPPQSPVDGWKSLPIQECGEPLVPLGPFSAYPEIFQDAIYAGERLSSPYAEGELDGALMTPFVREGIAEKLAEAAKHLPEGYALMIWDSYRPLAVQQALYDDFYKQLVNTKGLSPDEATIEAQRFVSIPSSDQAKPSPHNTGGSVDLTLIKFADDCLPELKQLNEDLKSDDWQLVYRAEMRRQQLLREKSTPVNMGTAFDEVSPKTATRFFEEKLAAGSLGSDEEECLKNRRILFNALEQAGLRNYPEEWWHFDSGNQFEAIRTGHSAIYGAAPFTQACREWEDMRRWHFLGVPQMQQGAAPTTQELEIFEKAFSSGKKAVDLHHTIHPKASRLQVS